MQFNFIPTRQLKRLAAGCTTGLLLTLQPLAAQVLVKDIVPGATASNPKDFQMVGSTLFFTAETAATGRELYKSNGTAAGTVLVKDITPGHAGSDFAGITFGALAAAGNTLYFTVNNGTNGSELWKSDGTAAGTVLVKDIIPGPFSAFPRDLTPMGGVLYFTVNSRDYGREVWKSDGTPAGTVLVKDLRPGLPGSDPWELTVFNGSLYFLADNGVSGLDVWKTNGTPQGTTLLKNLHPVNLGVVPQLEVAGGSLFFTGPGLEPDIKYLYKSNGTAAGTIVVRKFDEGSATAEVSLEALTKSGSLLYFIERVQKQWSGDKFSLYRTDGTVWGTKLLKTVDVGELENGGFPMGHLTDVGGTLFLSANSKWDGPELWKSDGTPEGTELVQDIRPGELGSDPYGLNNVGGVLYFGAHDGTHGDELWKSDGTAAGTDLVKDILPGIESAYLNAWAVHAGGLYFAADNGTQGHELWKLSVPILGPGGVTNQAAAGNPLAPNGGRSASPDSREAAETGLRATVHPNPATDYLSVHLVDAPAADLVSGVTDLTGKSFLPNAHRVIGPHALQVDVSSLKPGLYVLRLATGQGRKSLRFVKQ
jgi:ELWxxDGT repeat protein